MGISTCARGMEHPLVNPLIALTLHFGAGDAGCFSHSS